MLSCVQLFATPGTLAHQAPQSMGFSRQGYWSGWPCPPPGDLPDPGREPASRVSPVFTTEPLAKPIPTPYHTSELIPFKSFRLKKKPKVLENMWGR